LIFLNYLGKSRSNLCFCDYYFGAFSPVACFSLCMLSILCDRKKTRNMHLEFWVVPLVSVYLMLHTNSAADASYASLSTLLSLKLLLTATQCRTYLKNNAPDV